MIKKKTTPKKVPARRGRPPKNTNEAEKPKLTKKGKPTTRPHLLGNKHGLGNNGGAEKKIGNKYAVGNKGGPRKFKSVELLQEAIDAYFRYYDEYDKPYTVGGLALALGYSSRSELTTAESFGDDYSRAIKRAKFRIQESWERRLGSPSATGTIFWLKNNAGYIDESTLHANIDERSEASIDARLRDILMAASKIE